MYEKDDKRGMKNTKNTPFYFCLVFSELSSFAPSNTSW